MRTFIHDNRRTMGEFLKTDMMGAKKRIITVNQARNGIGVAAPGDKQYKAVEYADRFFHEGGLIAGSTNKTHLKTAGNAKAIDFYAGLKVDGPLNEGTKTWK